MSEYDHLTEMREDALARLGADLGVPARADGEDLEAFRVRVAMAFNNDAAIDAAVTQTPPTGFVLGGMKLGG